MSMANEEADVSIVEPCKKKNDDVIINELDSDSPAETESYAHAPLSNFYFFANQEIPAFNYDMIENKFQTSSYS
jgi:hypothetical protein